MTSDQNLSKQVTKTLISNTNCLFAIFSLNPKDAEMRASVLSVLFNTMAAVDRDMCKDFVLTNMHVSQLLIQTISNQDDSSAVVLIALECLELMLFIGTEIEAENGDGLENPVVVYCQRHLDIYDFERVQSADNVKVRELGEKIINRFFS